MVSSYLICIPLGQHCLTKLSSDGGNVTSINNQFLVSGKNGRVAELFNLSASFSDNTFKARLSNTTSKNQPLYINKTTKLKEENNFVQGF